MKNLRLTLLTAVLLAATVVSASAQTKVANVDMKKIFNGYWKTKQATTVLDNLKAELSKEVKDMADGLDKAQADYKQLLDQSNDQAIAADEREKRKTAAANKAREINNSKVALEQYQRQAQTQLADKSQSMSGKLVAEIQKAVADKAKAGGYTLVLNTATTEVVVYSDAQADITDSVLVQLNAGAPINVNVPSTGTSLNLGTNQP